MDGLTLRILELCHRLDNFHFNSEEQRNKWLIELNKLIELRNKLPKETK